VGLSAFTSWIGDEFERHCLAAGLPPIRLHDLRYGAATLLLGERVPLAIVSKMLRHSKVGITSDLYGHLVHDVAVDAAAAELRNERAVRDAATTSRPPEPIRAHAERVERQAIEPGKAKPPAQTGGSEKPRNGAAKGARTPDLLFTRQMLYQLSYSGLAQGSPGKASISAPVQRSAGRTRGSPATARKACANVTAVAGSRRSVT